MSGVQRFLSRRGRNKESKTRRPAKNQPEHFAAVFAEDDTGGRSDKEEERRIKGIIERLTNHGIEDMSDSNIRYALHRTHNHGDGDAAFRLLVLLQDTFDGLLKAYRPDVKLLGAVNRDSVTCYLDALLFSMFARLDSFEAMLYDNFNDAPRKRLAGLLRLWVNMLRTGRLVTTDITKQIQDALAQCGWQEAAMIRQQDPSEAFTFITGQLELPLLTLKMDLYHTGKEDPQDDHKFVNERMLEVAILDKPLEGRNVITLEDCLEHYFNNRIEVKRHMENQRRNTLKSGASDQPASPTKMEKDSGIHIETVEIASPDTPVIQTPISETPATPMHSKNPVEKLRPINTRQRADSIFSQRKVQLVGDETEGKTSGPDEPPHHAPPERKLSTRTEVLMPAWQFFKLLPWYTDHMPTSDAQVAAHFSRKRPVLGICLKRYSYTATGQATRLDTFVDIPLEIAVPNFVSDDNMQENGPLAGNFRLLLQSVVCHRGVSVHSGHYVCLCRARAATLPTRELESRRSSDSDEAEDPWMRFDDLAQERVSYVDIHEALRQETPYLVFYQVQPIDDDGYTVEDLPTYAEATSRSHSEAAPVEKPYLNEPPGSEIALQEVQLQPLSNDSRNAQSDTIDFAPASGRTSLDAGAALDGPRGRSSLQLDARRGSVAFDGSSFAGSISGGSIGTNNTASVPSTPSEEKNVSGLLSLGTKISSRSRSSRMSRGSNSNISRSRPSSTGPADANSSRFSLNMTKLTQRISRSDSQPPSQLSRPPTGEAGASMEQGVEAAASLDQAPVVVVAEEESRDSVDTAKPPPISTTSRPLLRKDKAAMRHEKRFKGKGQEDRECTLM